LRRRYADRTPRELREEGRELAVIGTEIIEHLLRSDEFPGVVAQALMAANIAEDRSVLAPSFRARSAMSSVMARFDRRARQVKGVVAKMRSLMCQ